MERDPTNSFALFVAAALVVAAPARAQTLSEPSVYYRCYGQLARGRPQADDPRLAAVRAGRMTAVDACIALLELAALSPDGRVHTRAGNEVDPIAQAVLKTFQDFHALWFPENDFNELPYDDPNYDLYDIGEMALHLTHALLAPSARFDEIVTAQQTYEAIRTSSRQPEFLVYLPTVSRPVIGRRYDSRTFRTGLGTPWTPTLVAFGKLVGVRAIPARRDVLSHVSGPRQVDLDIRQPLGGGIIGTIPFLLLNLGRYEGEHANGGLLMPRRWSKAVLKDLLCRDLPVLRATDAVGLVEPASKLPFRSSPTCMQCHGTMDGMAAVIRNVELARTSPGPGDFSFFVTKHIIANPRAPPNMSVAFDLEAPTGRLYFRDLAGALVDQSVTGPTEFGEFLAAHDDLYACAAKRYYAFLTGIEVRLQDPGDPALTQPEGEELEHRQQVMDLAAQLRADQSLGNLIRRIISLPIYATPGYQVER